MNWSFKVLNISKKTKNKKEHLERLNIEHESQYF